MNSTLEKLAETEHVQWMEWAGSVIGDIEILLDIISKKEFLSPEEREDVERISKRISGWSQLMVGYSELSEDEKEKDRLYARKVYEICKNESE